MEVFFKNLNKSRIVAIILLITQSVCILPSQEIILNNKYSKIRLEQYLSRADREKNAQDWQRVAEEGILLAMSEWESANIYLRETNYEKYEEEYKRAYDEFETIKNSEFAAWYMNKRLHEENDLKRSEIAQLLSEKSEEYKKKYEGKGAEGGEIAKSKEEWESYATEIVENYMGELAKKNQSVLVEIIGDLKEQPFTDEELATIYTRVVNEYEDRVYEEYGRIYVAEKNQLMSVLLYDTKSTKKLSAAQAAEEIAKETAKAVKQEADIAMNELFEGFNATIGTVEEDELEIQRTNWLNDFQKAFEESIGKWNEAERQFLAERSEWETSATEVYEANEKAWAEGYKILQQKRDAWFEEIAQKLEEGRKEWDMSEEQLSSQLETAYQEMYATLQKERDGKEKKLDMQISIYNQSREMLDIVASALEGVAETFNVNYYEGRYAYWKTENNEEPSDEMKKDIDELFEIINSFKKEEKPGQFFNDDSKIEKAIILVQKLIPLCSKSDINIKRELESLITVDGNDGWLKNLKEYKAKTLKAKEELYKLTGCIYNTEANNQNKDLVFFNELDYEIIKANVDLEYWTEEYEVANAVREYSESKDSTTETSETTQKRLTDAIQAYKVALDSYEAAVIALENNKSTVEKEQETVDEKYKELNEAKIKLEEEKKAYSELLVVYLGGEANSLKEKIKSLIVEYENRKTKSNEEELKEYYNALIEYTNEDIKQKYFEAKKNIENGTVQGSLSKTKAEEYKKEITDYINNLDFDKELTFLNEYIEKITIYCGENAYTLSNYLDEYTIRFSDKNREETITKEEQERIDLEKKQYENIIKKYLIAIEDFWNRELTKKTKALNYLKNGKFEKEADIKTEEERKEIEIKNYLNAIINAKTEWEENVDYDFTKYNELFTKIENIKEKSKNELILTIQEEIKRDEDFRKLMKGQDIFNCQILMDWIACDAQILNEKEFEEENMQDNIKELYYSYALNKPTNHSEAVTLINNKINKTNIENLTKETVYEFVDELRTYESGLNVYGKAALENYISSIIDYVSTKTVYEQKSELNDLKKQREEIIKNIAIKTNEYNKATILVNYGITDLKTVLEVMMISESGDKQPLYEKTGKELEEYAAYLIMTKLYSGDLEKCNNKKDIKNLIVDNFEKIAEKEKENSWEIIFNNLSDEIKSQICQNIYDIYYFNKAADSYEPYVNALNDFISLHQGPDGLHLAVDFEGISEELVQLVKANNFIFDYFTLSRQVIDLTSRIEDIEIKIMATSEERKFLEDRIKEYTLQISETVKELEEMRNESESTGENSEINNLLKQIEDIEQQKITDETRLNEILSLESEKAGLENQNSVAEGLYNDLIFEDEKGNNWASILKDYSIEDIMWLTMYLAGEKQFFIFLQTDHEDYEDIKIKLGEKIGEKLTETDISYIESYKKVNRIVDRYCSLVDGNIEVWINSIDENLTENEKTKIKDILNGTDFASNYYTYENDRQYILSSTGVGQIVYNRLNEFSNKISKDVLDLCKEQNDELKKLQVDLNFIDFQISAIMKDDVSWIEISKGNGLKSDSSMDEKTRDALSKWLDNNPNPYEKILDEKLETSIDHLRWLTEDSFFTANNEIDIDSVPGVVNPYSEKLNKAYSKYLSVNDCSLLVKDIISTNNSYKIANEERKQIEEMIEVSKNNLKKAEDVLKQKTKSWVESVNKLIKETDEYNTNVENADAFFTLLKLAEKNKRIAQEKLDYASSIYLKDLGEVAEKEYVSPQEKEIIVKFSLDKAKVRVDVLCKLKDEKYEASEEYTKAMTKYQESVKKHYEVKRIKIETDKSLAVQEDIVRECDAKLQEAYAAINNTEEITSIAKDSNTAKYVYIEKNTDGSYIIRLRKEGDGKCSDEFNNYIVKKAVSERIPGGYRNISQAMYDARQWFISVTEKADDYRKNLMLAAIYIKGNMGDYNLNTDNIPTEECQGIDFVELMNKYKAEVVEQAYKDIISTKEGQEDLAKYLLYNYEEDNKNGVLRNVFTEQYIESSYRTKVYERVMQDVNSRHGELVSESIAFAALASEYTFIAACCGWPACLIPAAVAAGFAIASGTMAYKAGVLKNDVVKQAEIVIGTVGDIFDIEKGKNESYLKGILEVKTNLELQWSNLNLMYTGSSTNETGKVNITEESVQTALKERTRNLCCDYSTMIENLYTEDVLKASGATKETSISEAIDKVNFWYSIQENEAKTELEKVISDLKEEQRGNQEIYETKLNENAELTQDQKKKLHELALKVSDKTLTAEAREEAKKAFEDYKAELLENSGGQYKSQLTELAKNTFGRGTWSTDIYLKDMHLLWRDLYPENIDLTSATETYTGEIIQNFKSIILEQFDAATNIQLIKLQEEQNKERKQLATKRKNWEDQMAVLVTIAEGEWDKAGESLVSGYNNWRKAFETEFNEKNAGWYGNYETFLQAKQEWINEQYLYAVNVANADVIEQSGLDVESTIAAALAATEITKLNYEPIEAEKYTENLIGKTGLNQIMNNMESLENKGTNASITRKHGYKTKTSSMDVMLQAEQTLLTIEEDMKDTAAKLAAEQANRIVEQTIAASMERIEVENEGMREWEETLVRNNGYSVNGTSITRNAIVDSTIQGGVYESQTVVYYQDFTTSKPTLTVSLTGTMLEGLTNSTIMKLVSQANSEIRKWNTEIFGDTEKDENGNVVQKYWTIPRSGSKTIHDTGITEVKTKYEQLAADENNKKDKARYEELTKKEYDKLGDDEKEELNDLSRKLITVRDGKLGEWIGYAPLFRSGKKGDLLDLEKSRESNVVDKGLGQMGAIMLDFQWNSMKANQGWTKLALPMYDQPLWRANGSFFEPPTIRGVSGIVFEIVGTAIGLKWFSYADDLIFAAIDAGGGFKSAEEIGLELAKTAAASAVSAGMGAASNALGDLAGEALQGAGKFANFAAQAGISMTTNYATTVTDSAINSFYIGGDGLAFNTDGFTKSLFSADTFGSAIGAGVTSGLNISTIGYDNQYVNGFNSQQIRNIQTFNSLMGGLATNTTSLLMEDNANFNLLNYKGVGLLNFSFGKDGISSKIGMGGTSISLQNLVSAFGGATHLHINSQIDNTEYDKTTRDALRSQYGFGDDVAKGQLDDIINGNTVLKFDAEGNELAQSINENGQKIIHINSTLNDGFIDLGLTLQHEVHRDGIVSDEQSQQIETTNAVLGHTVMAKKMQNDSLYKSMMNDIIDTNQNLQNDLVVFDYAVETGDWGAFGSYVNAAYDSSADYWNLEQNDDGTFGWSWDGDFDFNIKGIGKISAKKMKDYSNIYEAILEGEVVMRDGSITSEKIALNTIGVLFKEAGNNNFMQFIAETEDFADASIAGKMLANGNLCVDNINSMNIGLYAAQESGLLMKNEIGQIYDSSLPFVLNNPNDKTWITTQSGYDLFGGIIREHPELDVVVNTPEDGKYVSGMIKLVVPETSDMTLSYGSYIGLNATFAFGDSKSIIYGHMDSSSIYSYFAAFGTTGTSIEYNGILKNVPEGIQAGYIGNTGANSTGTHLHVGYLTGGNKVTPVNSFPKLGNIKVTPYAKVTSGLQNINSTNDTLKLSHIMDYYNYVNGNANWNKDSFGDFYFTYANIMDDSAFTVATIMYLYGRGR